MALYLTLVYVYDIKIILILGQVSGGCDNTYFVFVQLRDFYKYVSIHASILVHNTDTDPKLLNVQRWCLV